jgi:hypothetical protein
MLIASLGTEVVEELAHLGSDPDGTPTRAAAKYLAEMTEAEADDLLRSAGSTKLTPGGWGENSPEYRADIMTLLIAGQSDGVQSRLLMLVDDGPDADAPDLDTTPGAPLAPLPADGTSPPGGDETTVDADGPIFVVHGHAHASLHETVRVIERGTQREVIVLHEQPNEGRTIIEKFEHHAAGAAYAVVLLTADDIGGTGHKASHPRGRQNVIFELGFFFGKLGRNRVAVLLDPAVEKPSDIDGLVYVALDSAGAWKQGLSRELASVGIEIDYSRIP